MWIQISVPCPCHFDTNQPLVSTALIHMTAIKHTVVLNKCPRKGQGNGRCRDEHQRKLPLRQLPSLKDLGPHFFLTSIDHLNRRYNKRLFQRTEKIGGYHHGAFLVGYLGTCPHLCFLHIQRQCRNVLQVVPPCKANRFQRLVHATKIHLNLFCHCYVLPRNHIFHVFEFNQMSCAHRLTQNE
ncbi:hypothetical protein M378DRAFT_378864 [Amanita muscaria Koide BX008]|uniref:Uncharacterized protein n=1 Tax=Amanita muscaria (strain Koide BX008) TaxID=946122 RepID=A0A0C2WMY0_AMAMK|nr:hypothetical protein M378DRAFT_378864 [Amanita muscaria Koide BX008]